ncbi:MAG: hypothetical protein IAE79_07415 [Anaerolinea sp.]|nr:hypothetical protein [Anaerolinea sp.]
MAEKIDQIPENMSILEAAEFWDTHSVADYPSHVVEIEYAANRRMAVVPIAIELVAQLEDRAAKSGVSIETLVNLWLQERLSAA